jgi:FO synthase
MTTSTASICARAAAGLPVSDQQALALSECKDLAGLLAAAGARRDLAHPVVVSYSPKVFIPLTQLCRDVCRYCTYAGPQ